MKLRHQAPFLLLGLAVANLFYLAFDFDSELTHMRIWFVLVEVLAAVAFMYINTYKDGVGE